ncbi:hypothetical protein [Gorillibacterium sp. sgz5001074]|uniref:hypothetical protein n=1 Tax=Gorillibacterium sp. sgz5001074 TaxID=3446695 RepID=UPI003F66D373
MVTNLIQIAIFMIPAFSSITLFFLVLFSFTVIQIFRHYKLTYKPFAVSYPFVLLVFIGITSTLLTQYEKMDIVKDIVYYTTPILIIIVGHIFVQMTNFNRVLNSIVIAGIATSSWHLFKFALKPSVLSESLASIRNYAGLGSSLTVVSLCLLLFRKKYNLEFLQGNRLWSTMGIFLCLISLATSLSRTLIIITVLMLGIMTIIPMKQKIITTKTKSLKIPLTMFFLCFAVLTFSQVDFTNNELVKQLAEKMSRSLQEIGGSDNDYGNISDINMDWRGYEAYRAMIMFDASSNIRKLFGNGFGAQVDLGLYMSLNGELFNRVPILHNGYMYLLVKVGLVGILIHVLFMSTLIISGIKAIRLNNQLRGAILITVGLSTVFTTLVVNGVFNPEYSIWMFLTGVCSTSGSYSGAVFHFIDFRTLRQNRC